MKKSCEKCLCSEGKIKGFNCYQPAKQCYEKHFVCEKCIASLVERYFSRVSVL